MEPLDPNQQLTPAQAARISGLSHAMVCRCFDRGMLKGYKIPDIDRRIPMESLQAFIREHNIPTAENLSTELENS